jgi:hypothetical protein
VAPKKPGLWLPDKTASGNSHRPLITWEPPRKSKKPVASNKSISNKPIPKKTKPAHIPPKSTPLKKIELNKPSRIEIGGHLPKDTQYRD